MQIKRGKYYSVRFRFQGRIYQKTTHSASLATAKKIESTMRADLLRGEFGIFDAAKCPTLHEVQSKLKDHWKVNVAPRTAGFYGEHLKILDHYAPMAHTKLHRIDSALIEKFVQYRVKDEVSVTTINHSLRTLRRILHLAKSWNLIRVIPEVKLLPGENQREFVLTDSMITNMMTLARKDYKKTGFDLLLGFLVDTGLRISEACSLKIEDVTFTEEMPVSIRVTKGKSKYAVRELRLTQRAALAVLTSIDKSKCDYVFTGKGGKKPISRHYASEIFRTLRAALNLPEDCVLHSTRHTFCTRLGNRGANATTIQKLAGHSSITISQRYVHPDAQAKWEAIMLLEDQPAELESH